MLRNCPVLVDNTLVGNVSNDKPLSMKAAEGNHTVKVCVGILCVNDTAVTKFAQPVYLDFGERLKDVMEFSTPTIRIIDTTKSNNRVVVAVEFINPTKKDLSMAATVRVAYSYIAPSTRYREGNAVQSDVTRSVKDRHPFSAERNPDTDRRFSIYQRDPQYPGLVIRVIFSGLQCFFGSAGIPIPG